MKSRDTFFWKWTSALAVDVTAKHRVFERVNKPSSGVS